MRSKKTRVGRWERSFEIFHQNNLALLRKGSKLPLFSVASCAAAAAEAETVLEILRWSLTFSLDIGGGKLGGAKNSLLARLALAHRIASEA